MKTSNAEHNYAWRALVGMRPMTRAGRAVEKARSADSGELPSTGIVRGFLARRFRAWAVTKRSTASSKRRTPKCPATCFSAR